MHFDTVLEIEVLRVDIINFNGCRQNNIQLALASLNVVTTLLEGGCTRTKLYAVFRKLLNWPKY